MSATQARKVFFDILNDVQYSGIEVIFERNGVPVTKILAPTTSRNLLTYIEEIKKLRPFITDADVLDMEKAREDVNTGRFQDW
jgi:hypothetical protein